MRKFWFYLLLTFCFSTAFASSSPEPLSADQAFRVSTQDNPTDSILVSWTIAPNYYLYRDKFHFKIISPKDAILGSVIFPQGFVKDDPFFGKEEIYKNNLVLPIPVMNPTTQTLKIAVSYQGCSAFGFCYPPMTKQIALQNGVNAIPTITDETPPTIKENTFALTLEGSLSNQNQASSILANKHLLTSLALFFGLGILLAFTPCLLPMIPILSSIIVGQKTPVGTRRAFRLSLTYILAMAVTYAIAGMVVGLLGKNIQAYLQNPWVLASFSGIFILGALSMFGLYNIQMPAFIEQRLQRIQQKQTGGSYISVAAMGILATLVMSPCVSAPLVGALTFIAQTGNAILGGSALFALGLGMGLPLLIIGTSLGKWLPKGGAWMERVKHLFGFLMIGLALWLLSRIVRQPFMVFLWGGFALSLGIYAFFQAYKNPKRWRHIWWGFSSISVIYGVLLCFGGAVGNQNIWLPSSYASHEQRNPYSLKFTPVANLAELQIQLAKAQAAGKPVMLDFYADWCTACKAMAQTTFVNSDVNKALHNYVLLQANVTANNQPARQLQQYYGVIAPPAILFFENGQEITTLRMIGEQSAQEFLKRLHS